MSSAGLAPVLLYRVATFYPPPVLGSFGWLRRNRYV
jgi:hypothetical protein